MTCSQNEPYTGLAGGYLTLTWEQTDFQSFWLYPFSCKCSRSKLVSVHIISLKLIRSYLYWAYFATQVFMLENMLEVIKWHLKTLYNSDCHYLAVLKTLDNLGFSIIVLFASCHPMNLKTNWKKSRGGGEAKPWCFFRHYWVLKGLWKHSKKYSKNRGKNTG